MKYLKSTQAECASILSDMDTYYNYPDSSKFTTTTAKVLLVEGSEYMVAVPNDYYERLTTSQKNKCVIEYPIPEQPPVD